MQALLAETASPLKTNSTGRNIHTHILTIDYRGFGGHSTSFPTETGLITDGIAAVEWAVNVGKVPRSRIIILGHSLGTAVGSATFVYYNGREELLEQDHHFKHMKCLFDGPRCDESTSLVGERQDYVQNMLGRTRDRNDQPLAGLMLLSGFSDLSTLLQTYMLFGFIPILGHIHYLFPTFTSRLVNSFAVDTWKTARRLRWLDADKMEKMGSRVHLIHAKDDWEIVWRHSDALFEALTSSFRCRSEASSGDTADLLPAKPLEERPRIANGAWERICEVQSDWKVKEWILGSGGENITVTHISSLRTSMS